ncbi:DUF3631 domain-containing protein [Mycobacterium riyadhense]|uniref:DUF3631 domain-containing protein n=1 Tax=Mycobacterium riyadhense TaxID=486698 RepID=UPI002094C668|nr:DUF3631 domain-containing protein [Mycobacterium riyadhense]
MSPGSGGRPPERDRPPVVDRGGETGQVTIHHKAYDRLVAALHAAGRQVIDRGDAAHAQCPAHDDGRPSLSLRRIDGSVLVYCHAGCQIGDVLAALSLDMRDLYDDRAGQTYAYGDGRKVRRTADKKFWQSANTKGRSLFHAERIGAATTVHVVEGEKDVLAVESVGGTAVCSAMGAGKAHLFDWSPLRGREVIIVADRDEPGRKHARDVADIVRGIAASVRIVEAAAGKDAADHIAAGHALDELVDVTPPEVDGAALLDELLAVIKTYVVLPDDHAAVSVALWIATTHALPAFDCAPRLVITSPEKRCGKTRLLDIITGTCHKPLATVDATVAAIFRSLGGEHPRTLIIDEADAIFGSKKVAEQNEDLRKLLNAGHQRGKPALRCVGPAQIPTEFDTFAMAAMAGIGAMPDTVVDRGVNITQRRRASGEKVSQFRARRDGPILAALRDRLAAWAAARINSLSTREPDMPVEDRAADTWEPLIAVADEAGGHWPTTSRQACKALVDRAADTDEDRSLAVKLLADIKAIFADRRVPFLASADLVAELRRVEDSPWNDFELNPSKLAYRLREFGVKPGRNTVGSVRGYAIEAFADAFSRYTRQNPSGPSETTDEQGKSSDRSEPSDGSGCQTDLTRQTETADQIPYLTGQTGSDAPPAKNGSTARKFTPPTGPGRCHKCGFHVATQGHRDGCSAKTRAPIGGITPTTPGMTDRVVAALAKAVER